MARWVRFVLVPLVALQLTLLTTCGVWETGRISRVKVAATSPAGGVVAVCRGRLPESTEYELWLRRWWQPFGTFLAHSGTESMGRCRDIVWSPDGTLLLVVNEGNSIVIIDVVARRRLAVHGRLAPGDSWDYTSARIITSLRFVSDDGLEFEHCDRLWVPPGNGGDFSRCGQDVRRDRARLTRTGSSASVSVFARN